MRSFDSRKMNEDQKRDMELPGAKLQEDGSCRFLVWAPKAENMKLLLEKGSKTMEMEKISHGYWEKKVEGIKAGTLYKFRIDNNMDRPDPASRSQPEGVHEWSQVVDNKAYSWNDKGWKGLEMEEMIIYELHVGTFTAQGTFEAVLSKLDHLLTLGINCIEVMPVSQFPGSRNWGYDGVYPYAVQHSYGGVSGLKKLVDGCHQKGIAVILDTVYNHLGPEGSYLADFGPYFTDKYKTPWGSAINFDDMYSDVVRNYFLESARMWLKEFRFDGLRLDAVHEILDMGPSHFLRDLSHIADEVEAETGRKKNLIAESDLNDVKLINAYHKGGYGLEAQWADDFHHSAHVILSGEKEGYYSDYGKMGQIEKTFKQAMVYDGVYSSFRKRIVGNSPKGLPAEKFVVCIQNHDQVGNRLLGERLSKIVSFEKQKLAAGLLLTAPFVPMLFMGEEYGEDAPFQYFVSHGDPELVKAVQEGRKREFEYFHVRSGKFPDPQSEETFNNSKLKWDYSDNEEKEILFRFYKKLIDLRKEGEFKPFRKQKPNTQSDENTKVLKVISEGKKSLLAVFNFNHKNQKVSLRQGDRTWKKIMASSDSQWGGKNDFYEKIKEVEIEIPSSAFVVLKAI